MFIYKDKVILITGGAKRIGAALVKSFCEKGTRVALHYHRSEAEAQLLCKAMEQEGYSIQSFQANLLDPLSAKDMFAKVCEKMGSVDVLINNASIYDEMTLQQTQPESLDENFNIHLKAPFVLCKALFEKIGNGQIINILDAGMNRYDKKHVAYQLSKKSLHVLNQMMAIEFAPRIRVNAVAPGPILCPEGFSQQLFESYINGLLIPRAGNPSEVMSAICFLLENEYITGQVVHVDGGYHLKDGVLNC